MRKLLRNLRFFVFGSASAPCGRSAYCSTLNFSRMANKTLVAVIVTILFAVIGFLCYVIANQTITIKVNEEKEKFVASSIQVSNPLKSVELWNGRTPKPMALWLSSPRV